MNVALIGYGKMGKEIERYAPDRKITIVNKFDLEDNRKSNGLTLQALKKVDVCIDFSSPGSVIENIKACARCGKNIVVGTTGWYGRMNEVKKIVKSKGIGLLYSP